MRRLSTASILLLISLIMTPAAGAEVADRIVAVVNDDIITLSELNEEGGPYFQELIKKAPTDQLQGEMQKLRQEVLSHLVDLKLIEQQAATLEIKINDEEITQAIDTILAENNVTREDMKKDLATKGLSEERYRSQIKNQMLQSRLINHEIRSKVVVTDEKVNQYYQENYTAKPAGGATSSGYHLLQMGFLWGEKYKKKSADEAKQAAQSAKKQLESGQNFAEVASAISDLPSKEDGGDIGVFEKDELAPFMKDAVLSLKPGETSGIIETPEGYQIIKLLSSQDGGQLSVPPLVEVKKDIESKIYKQESEQLYKKWISELRTKAFIKQNL